jgi:ABC-2 type transport system permease protein
MKPDTSVAERPVMAAASASETATTTDLPETRQAASGGAPSREGPIKSEFTRGFLVVANRELQRLVHDRARLISQLAMPLMFFVIFGAGFNRMISSNSLAPGVSFIEFLFPGIVAQTVFMTSIFSGLSVVWDREFGFLRELLVAPISRLGIVFGKIAGASALAIVQAVIVMFLAPVLKVHIEPMALLKLLPLIVLVSLTLSSFGILLASRMRSQQAFQMLMQLFIMPMIFFSGIFFPLNHVPGWLTVVSLLNPLTYGVDAIRHAMLGAEIGHAQGFGVVLFGHTMGIWEEAGIMGAVGIIMLLAALVSFNKQE